MFITLPSVHPVGAGVHRGGGREEEDPAGAGLPSPPLLQARKEVTGSAHTVVGGFVFTLQDSSGPLDTVSASRSDRQDVTMEMGGWLKARQPGAVTPATVSTPGLLPAPICGLLQRNMRRAALESQRPAPL